jgi:hypothetical protein
MYMTTDVEVLISRLSYPLAPNDRCVFRRDCERALAASRCWGEGSVYRALTEVWRQHFHPLPDGPRTRWDIADELCCRGGSKLMNRPPIGDDRRRRISTLRITG